MTKSELIEKITYKFNRLSLKQVDICVGMILEIMTDTLANGRRIEIRGFGSFNLHHHEARISRNPKTGEPVKLPARDAVHFKPGKEFKERVNATYQAD